MPYMGWRTSPGIRHQCLMCQGDITAHKNPSGLFSEEYLF
jgi:hypothetical protein